MARGGLLRKLARKLVPPDLLKFVPRGFEVVGDIAILNLPKELDEYKFEIARALLESLRPRIRLVVKRASPARDPERIHDYEILAGSGGLETLHKEGGCVFKVDISKAFFSSRLQYERARIASLVRPGEIVINMFAGVGSFSIVIAKRVPNVRVYSIDVNPEAYKLMVENVKLNRVRNKVVPLLGNAAEVVDLYNLKGVADRVLMPSPEHAINYLAKAVESLRARGFIHYYDVAHRVRDLREHVLKRVSPILDGAETRWRVEDVRVIRSVAPSKSYICADLYVEKKRTD